MKQVSAATRAILDAGQALRLDLYDFVLAGGAQTYSFTTGQQPTLVGNKLYRTGLLIARGSTTQKVGLEVQSLQLTITPQPDAASGAVVIAGFPFLQACAQRVLDGCRVTFSKMFLNDYADTSPGAAPWFQGRVNVVTVDRVSAVITINSDIEMLNVQAPGNVLQPGCLHTLFDKGCGLIPSAYQRAGTTGVGSDTLNVICPAILTDGYFALGRLTFTTGRNAGIARAVKSYTLVGGGNALFTFPSPLPYPALPGDAFVALPGCDKLVTTCTTKFANQARFRGYPYIPVPETLYDGGTVQSQRANLGGQGGAKTGSPFGGQVGARGAFKA